MTTIVTDGKTMAGDTQLSDEGGPLSHGRKVYKSRGTCIGIAGTYADCIRFVNWWKRGMKGNFKDIGDVSALLLSPEGKIFYFDGEAQSYLVTDKFMAIGSGAAAAMGAMHMGATPKQAVKVASKVDQYTGGKITTRSIKG